MFAKSIGNFGSPKSLTINCVLKFPVCGLKQEILKLRPYDNYFRYKKQEVAFRLHFYIIQIHSSIGHFRVLLTTLHENHSSDLIRGYWA